MSWEIVVTTRSVTQVGIVFAGRVTDQPAEKHMVWLDVNYLGTHLPQMYRPQEFEVATTLVCRKHDLCETCLGYGLLNLSTDNVCHDCHGSGSSEYWVDQKFYKGNTSTPTTTGYLRKQDGHGKNQGQQSRTAGEDPGQP